MPKQPPEDPSDALDQTETLFDQCRILGMDSIPLSTRERPEDEERTALDLSKEWEALIEEILTCTKCPLHLTRTNAVPGGGDRNAQLVFIGEAPGFHEDRQGQPFVGRAGDLLTRMIAAMGFTRDQVYICNIIKCRPPQNRDPMPLEIEMCEPYLIRQLELLRPRAIVTLGRYSSQTLLRETTGIGKLRGRLREYHGIPLMPTYHPAALLRNPNLKGDTWEDLKRVMEILE